MTCRSISRRPIAAPPPQGDDAPDRGIDPAAFARAELTAMKLLVWALVGLAGWGIVLGGLALVVRVARSLPH